VEQILERGRPPLPTRRAKGPPHPTLAIRAAAAPRLDRRRRQIDLGASVEVK